MSFIRLSRYSGQQVVLELPIKRAEMAVFSSDGKEISVPDVPGKGKITICCSVPTVYSNVCGWYREIKSDIFNNITASKIWVTIADGKLNIYNSPFSGNLLRCIKCEDIADVEEIM